MKYTCMNIMCKDYKKSFDFEPLRDRWEKLLGYPLCPTCNGCLLAIHDKAG